MTQSNIKDNSLNSSQQFICIELIVTLSVFPNYIQQLSKKNVRGSTLLRHLEGYSFVSFLFSVIHEISSGDLEIVHLVVFYPEP